MLAQVREFVFRLPLGVKSSVMVSRRHGEQHSGRRVLIWEAMPLTRHARRSGALAWVFCLLCLAFPATLATPCLADDFTGEVINVIDGDTLTVVHDGVEDTVRLNAIDCPEKNQPYGKDAQRFTRERVIKRIVTIQAKEVDRDGRIVADVVLADGTILNHELVRQGLAWWFFRYSKDATLKAFEMEARDSKKGSWQDPIPIPTMGVQEDSAEASARRVRFPVSRHDAVGAACQQKKPRVPKSNLQGLRSHARTKECHDV